MNKELLRKTMEAPSVSGNEGILRDIFRENIAKTGLDLSFDNLGSIWGIKKSSNKNAPTLLIDAHIDEVGFQVTNITKEGLVQFETLSYVHKQTFPGLSLCIYNQDLSDYVVGAIIDSKNGYYSEKYTPTRIEDLFLDIGATSKEEAIKMGVNVGNSITYNHKTSFQEKSVIGKSADNRVGATIILELMEYISKKSFDYNIIIGGSVQEEVGVRGARTSMYKFKPDLAIVMDVSPALSEDSEGFVGKGTILRHSDALMITPKSVTNFIRKLLEENKIKYQDYFSRGATNAGIIHISNEGCKTIPIGLVAKNLHRPAQLLNVEDYDGTLKLAQKIIDTLNADFIKDFK